MTLLKNLLLFGAGAILGSAVVYKLTKDHYEELLKSETDAMEAEYQALKATVNELIDKVTVDSKELLDSEVELADGEDGREYMCGNPEAELAADFYDARKKGLIPEDEEHKPKTTPKITKEELEAFKPVISERQYVDYTLGANAKEVEEENKRIAEETDGETFDTEPEEGVEYDKNHPCHPDYYKETNERRDRGVLFDEEGNAYYDEHNDKRDCPIEEIDLEEMWDNDEYDAYDKLEFIYYDKDSVLFDDSGDEIIEPWKDENDDWVDILDDWIGHNHLSKLVDDMGEEGQYICVRNHKYRTDIQLYLSLQGYYEDVLGIPLTQGGHQDIVDLNDVEVVDSPMPEEETDVE